MDTNVKHMSMRILVLIAAPKAVKKALEMYQDGAIPIQYEWNARGTASSEMMDILGLGSSEKRILICFLPKKFADELLIKLKTELKLDTVNSGIAFTLPMSGVNNLILKLVEKLDTDELQEQKRKEDLLVINMKYSLITVIVNQGYSEEVMDAAKSCGASGGTIVHSRRIGNKEVTGFWGMNIQEEKEMIFIVADEENKMEIMKKITEKSGMQTEAQGIVLSLPIENVVGGPAQ